jgi:hypothetical protein
VAGETAQVEALEHGGRWYRWGRAEPRAIAARRDP